ncbi:6-aminohexanoate-cyclic-dimer hydrolase (plasmid) [Neorhizobium galegae bv. officinalis bv. officinalis str. HAMBI 1141]|uniref:Indoleacetamide hydrolase n=1 Tax=Neorhizobium galegae bv. officinalis bv. officinalis str. HAMBI 1141 TaxID=1028801 RepID=A0A068THN8_NEOGA|nr:amidase [Neorhizobium galegae]CDN57634.1 6-aminohexanoate-cyclic-dimer hydrolase [Neorhizobium galegae bv. officinalis bv. officinalis str. HAMBI 1141]
MTFEEYRSKDGIALADLLANREASAVELMRIAIDAAERVAGATNMLSYKDYDSALAKASCHEVAEGKFSGLPFLLKDSGLACTDIPTSIGSSLFEDTKAESDATLVRRFRDAGFIAFARSTVPELCMAPTTEARRNGGPTRNPFDLTRSSGGSSGGAAVAVAAGVVPVAHGSDGGGSIRIPASCCGVFGLKPSRGRVPMGPFRGEGWGGLACDGVLTRSVRDTARALDLTAGMEAGAPYAAPPGGNFEACLDLPLERPLRIAVWKDPWGLLVDEPCHQAVQKTAKLCAALGHETVAIEPPRFDYADFIDAIVSVMAANIALAARTKLSAERRDPRPHELEPAILDGYFMGARTTATDYIAAVNTLHATGRMMATMIEGYDLVLSPSLATLPPTLGTISTKEADFRGFRRKAGELTPFLAVVNASGQPAASLPLWRHKGLPVGVQLIGHFGREDMVLALSHQLEESSLWSVARGWPL